MVSVSQGLTLNASFGLFLGFGLGSSRFSPVFVTGYSLSYLHSNRDKISSWI